MATENCNSDPPPPISKLGDDLLVQVLIRSPEARLACRCKLVCKLWNALISDPYFVRRFVSHHGDETPLLPSDSILSFLPVPDSGGCPISVMDSFKDLLLCGYEDDDWYANGELFRSYVVCNPVTKQWISLPLAPEKSEYYGAVVARLVCEPLGNSNSDNNNLDLGDGKGFAYYRFRVVCIYSSEGSTNLDVFCSESREWTKKPLVLDRSRGVVSNVMSKNGELFWRYWKSSFNSPLFDPWLAAFNPFCLDTPLTLIDASAVVFGELRWDISVSQDALYIVSLDEQFTDDCSTNVVSVWRLAEDRKSWRKQYQMKLDRKSKALQEFEEHMCRASVLHSKKPEIVFLEFVDYMYPYSEAVILSCNSKSGEIQISKRKQGQLLPSSPVFQLWNHSWPTPIPRYEELRGVYDGTCCSWLVQGSNNSLPQ